MQDQAPELAGYNSTQSRLEPGQIVRVRSRQYLVESIGKPSNSEDATLVRLSCVEDDAQGEPLEVLWELEPAADMPKELGWDRLTKRGFDTP